MEGESIATSLQQGLAANCGKTFFLSPSVVIYNCFENPATSTFEWVGAEEKEVILLNDLRWTPSLIPWHDFLLLLEGQPVHLPAPKSYSTSLIPWHDFLLLLEGQPVHLPAPSHTIAKTSY